MALNTTGLNEAYQRKTSGKANQADIANLNYAQSKGWKYQAPSTPAIPAVQKPSASPSLNISFKNIGGQTSQPLNSFSNGTANSTTAMLPKSTLANSQTASASIKPVANPSSQLMNNFNNIMGNPNAAAAPSQTNLNSGQVQAASNLTPTTSAVKPAKVWTPTQISGLNAAWDRKNKGTANAKDLQNLSYATTNGWTPGSTGTGTETSIVSGPITNPFGKTGGTEAGTPIKEKPVTTAASATTSADSRLNALYDMLLASRTPNDEEKATADQLQKQKQAMREGLLNTEQQVIPMDFITGQQAAIEKLGTNKATTLQEQLATLQQKRTGDIAAQTQALGLASAQKEREQGDVTFQNTLAQSGYRPYQEGIMLQPNERVVTLTNPISNVTQKYIQPAGANLKEVSMGASLVNTLTGQPIYQGAVKPNVSYQSVGDKLVKITTDAFTGEIINTEEMGLTTKSTQAIKTAISTFNTADNMLNMIAGMASKVITADNPSQIPKQYVEGNINKIAAFNPDAKTYLDTVQAFTSMLARAAGEKGVLTDYDVARIGAALPSLNDTKQSAGQKFDALMGLYTAIKEGSINALQQDIPGTITGAGSAPTGGANAQDDGWF